MRWVNDSYEVFEDPVGLFALPNTSANTITEVIKDVLIRCDLPLSLSQGQAYDRAATMQGRWKGVATQIRDSNPAALPVHCFGHCLNLCLQDVGRQIPALRDALDIVREIGKLIKYSPERSHLWSQKLAEADSDSIVAVKSLCTTRWTARTSAIDAVLKDYPILMETMSEVNATTRDEYGLKADGILAALEKFSTLGAKNSEVFVYISLYSSCSSNGQQQIACLLKADRPNIELHFVDVHKQSGNSFLHLKYFRPCAGATKIIRAKN